MISRHPVYELLEYSVERDGLYTIIILDSDYTLIGTNILNYRSETFLVDRLSECVNFRLTWIEGFNLLNAHYSGFTKPTLVHSRENMYPFIIKIKGRYSYSKWAAKVNVLKLWRQKILNGMRMTKIIHISRVTGLDYGGKIAMYSVVATVYGKMCQNSTFSP